MSSVNVQDFVPEDQWPPVSGMVEGFGQQTLQASAALNGCAFSFTTQSGEKAQYHFIDAENVNWSCDQWQGTSRYKAIEARPDIFIIDLSHGEGLDMRYVTLIYDRNNGAVTRGTSRFVQVNGRTRSVTDFCHGNAAGANAQHARSSALVGKRVFYRYSDVETYEHIYLNSGTFTWHCLRGGEEGLADTDRCMAWEVAEDLYIFFWTEKVMVVEAVLLVDLQQQRSIGRMFGWDDKDNHPVEIPFNSRLTVLNTSVYPQDTHKH